MNWMEIGGKMDEQLRSKDVDGGVGAMNKK